MRTRPVYALLAMGLVAASAAVAGTVTIDCTNNVVLDQSGAPLPCPAAPNQHNCTNLAISVAGNGDTIYFKGMCITNGFTTLDKQVLMTGDCDSGIERNFNPAGGTAFRFADGATGSTIEGLVIKGNTNALSNSFVPGANNPDNITIRNNTLIALSLPAGGRCIQQFTGNGCGGPGCNRNDPNPCDGTLETVSDHWIIDGNTCESAEIGFLLSGNDFQISRNWIKAVHRGINTQNNHLSPVSVGFGGAAPGVHRNLVYKNVIEVADIGAGDAEGLGTIEFGIDLFGGLTGVPACDGVFGAGNVWSHNCITAQDGGAAGSSSAFITIAMKSTSSHHNNYTLLETPNPPSTGNGGIINFGSDNLWAAHNKISGADIALQGAAIGTEKGVVMNHNHIGAPTPSYGGAYVIVDNSVETNQYCGNLYCSPMAISAPTADLCAGAGPGNNAQDSFCKIDVSHDCDPHTNSFPKTCNGIRRADRGAAGFAGPARAIPTHRSLGSNRPVMPAIDSDSAVLDTDSISAGSGRDR